MYIHVLATDEPAAWTVFARRQREVFDALHMEGGPVLSTGSLRDHAQRYDDPVEWRHLIADIEKDTGKTIEQPFRDLESAVCADEPGPFMICARVER